MKQHGQESGLLPKMLPTQNSATSSERRFKYLSLCVACLTLLQKEISAVVTLSRIGQRTEQILIILTNGKTFWSLNPAT